MKAKELRGFSKQELEQKLEENRKKLMELKFKQKTGIDKPHLFKLLKKDIARILTVLKEKEREDENQKKNS